MDARQNVKSTRGEQSHNIIVENRKRISISGVEDIESFNEEEIVLHTSMGVLIVSGENLHINKLSVDSGDTEITGEVSDLKYPENYGKSKGAGLLGKLLK